MIATNDAVDAAKVAQAAKALIDMYGTDALAHAIRLEQESGSPHFASAVRIEVERRLGNASPQT
jgi:hypothetical protein